MLPLFVWLYGWQTVDLVEWRILTAAPFTLQLDPAQQFLYGSPLGYMLGAYYQRQGIGVAESFVIVHGIGLVLAAYAVVRVLKERCGTEFLGAAVLVLAASPLLLTITSWIGKDDTFLLAFYLLALASRSSLTRVVLCVAMVMCHRELALIMIAGHVLVRRDGAAVIAGAIAGVIMSVIYTNVLLSAAPMTRLSYMLLHARGLIAKVAADPLIHLVAALGPFWLFVLRRPSLQVSRMLVLLMAAGVASMTLDFTRVFVLAATPLLIVLTEEIIAEVRETGGVWLLGRRWSIVTLGWLALVQVQLAGDRLSSLRGLVWTVAR